MKKKQKKLAKTIQITLDFLSVLLYKQQYKERLMAGLAIDNLKDNPERFLLLKQKIKKKDDFTLTNKKKVVLDYRDSTIKTIFLADDFDTKVEYDDII